MGCRPYPPPRVWRAWVLRLAGLAAPVGVLVLALWRLTLAGRVASAQAEAARRVAFAALGVAAIAVGIGLAARLRLPWYVHAALLAVGGVWISIGLLGDPALYDPGVWPPFAAISILLLIGVVATGLYLSTRSAFRRERSPRK